MTSARASVRMARRRITIAPVCLNSLLYKTEKDLEQISRWLGHAADAEKWQARAERPQRVDHALSVGCERGILFRFQRADGSAIDV